MSDLELISEYIGYQFKQKHLLELALTHRSTKQENNERLEFVGDAVLNLIIGEALFHKFPQEKEGTLSRVRSNLVNGDTLAKIGEELKIGDFIRVGRGERKLWARVKSSIIADAVEAIIAAVYLDSDIQSVRHLVLTWFSTRLRDAALTDNIKDAKTRLQEYLQGRKFNVPEYSITKIEGEAHQQTFYTSCRIKELDLASEGVGHSRRRSEQSAAQACLKKLNIKDD